MVCVRKKDGSMRLCINYKELNKKIQPDKMPIQRIKHILDNLGEQKSFSKLYMFKARNQGFMDKESKHLTGLLHFKDYTSGCLYLLDCPQPRQLFKGL